MLSPDILNALKGYTAAMSKDVALVLQTGSHEKRDELKKFLEDVASVSERITVVERDEPEKLMSPISFLLEVDGALDPIELSTQCKWLSNRHLHVNVIRTASARRGVLAACQELL